MGRTFDLRLPHLAYGYVMFNRNPRTVWTFQYERQGLRGNLADLVPVPAPGYKRTRVAMNLVMKPDYLHDICSRAIARAPEDRLTFIVNEYRVDVDPLSPAETLTFVCDQNGLVAQ